MPDLTTLRDLTPLVRPRDLDDLEAVLRRRRRTTALVTVASAGTALAVVVAGATLGPRTATPAPVAPEPGFGFGSTPERPSVTAVTTTVEVPDSAA